MATSGGEREERQAWTHDSIVVSVNSRQNKTWFTGIYVTRRLGLGRFDETCSYQISQGLID